MSWIIDPRIQPFIKYLYKLPADRGQEDVFGSTYQERMRNSRFVRFAGNNVDDIVHIRVILEKIKKIQITNLGKKNQR